MLCCIFNYAPKYRESIYKKIDDAFDVQFIFGREVIDGQTSGIARLDYHIFKRFPIENRNILLLNKVLWRTRLLTLPFNKKYKAFLITADTPLSYIPFFILCRLLGKKVYCWGHGFKEHLKRFRILEKLYLATVEVFFTYGVFGKKKMEELGWKREKISVIYNSLNEGTALKENISLNSNIYTEHFRNSFPTLIFIGRLIPSKRIDWILEAMADLREKGLDLNLMIIGKGSVYDYLKNHTETLALTDRVWFYGECYNEDELKVLLYNADLCVSPGEVGLTALHTMTYGVPVISHNNFYKQGPEYELIIPDKTGLLYEYENYNDLTEKIHYWFTHAYDRNKVRRDCYRIINEKWNSNYQIQLLLQEIKLL